MGDTILVKVEDLPPTSKVNLTVQCPVCKEMFFTSLLNYNNILKTYEEFMCRRCVIHFNANQTLEHIYLDFKDRNMFLVTKTYINCQQSLDYYCTYHPDEPQQITYNSFQSGAGCKYCAREEHSERMRGVGNPAWVGGYISVARSLRRSIRWWFNAEAQKYNYKCDVTGDPLDNVHHTIPYHRVVKDVLQTLGLPVHQQINDYTQEELVKIQHTLTEWHKSIKGVPLRKDVHKCFHDNYSYDSFSLEDYLEFKERVKKGEFTFETTTLN